MFHKELVLDYEITRFAHKKSRFGGNSLAMADNATAGDNSNFMAHIDT